MLLTEEEAKTKRCQEGFAAATGISADGIPVMQAEPMGPIHPHNAAGYYGVSRGGAPMNCIGSACMAWRWLEWADDGKLGSPRGTPLKGFCGKAGRLY